MNLDKFKARNIFNIDQLNVTIIYNADTVPDEVIMTPDSEIKFRKELRDAMNRLKKYNSINGIKK